MRTGDAELSCGLKTEGGVVVVVVVGAGRCLFVWDQARACLYD